MPHVVRKACTTCGLDVSQQKRVKDGRGQYHCHPCWALVSGRPAEPAPPQPTDTCARCRRLVYTQTLVRDRGTLVCPGCYVPPARPPVARVAVAAVVLAVLGLSAYLFFSGRWERTHRDRLGSV